MTQPEAITILSRWVIELQEDLRAERQRNHDLEDRVRVADDMRWWMNHHTPVQVMEMAGALDTCTL